MTARHVFYTGRVQGVELFAQAFEADELEAFLDDIQQSSLSSHIKEREVNAATAETSLRGFSIVR